MQPDETHLTDLIRVYEGSFGEPLSLEEARDLYDRLLDLYARLKRVPPDWRDEEPSEASENRSAAGIEGQE